MMRIGISCFVVAVASMLVATEAGCSDADVDGAPVLTGEVAKKKSTKKSTDEGSATSKPSRGKKDGPLYPAKVDGGAPATPAPTGACGGSATGAACYTCCEQQAPASLEIWQGAFQDCLCGTSTGNCKDACGASLCNGEAADALCEQCINAATTCSNNADTLCAGNLTCAPLTQCDTASQCANKP